MILGMWFENINGKHGTIDELLTPLPLGVIGLGIVFLEEILA